MNKIIFDYFYSSTDGFLYKYKDSEMLIKFDEYWYSSLKIKEPR